MKDEAMTDRKAIDDVAIDVLLFVEQQPGEYFATEPGVLIHSLAEEIDATYNQTRLAIRYLEQLGFVWVGRISGPDPRQHNLLYEVRVLRKEDK